MALRSKKKSGSDQAASGKRLIAMLMFLLNARSEHDAKDIRRYLEANDLLEGEGVEENRIRMVQRDLDLLSSAAGNFINRRLEGRRYIYSVTRSPAAFLHLPVEDDEVAAVIALRGLAKHFGIKEAENGADEVLRRMAHGADAEAWIDGIDRMIHVYGAPGIRRGVQPDVFTEILRAIHAQLPIRFSYPVHAPKKHTVIPIRIIVNRGELYLAAVGAADPSGHRFYYKLSRVVANAELPVKIPSGAKAVDTATWAALQRRFDTMLKKTAGIWDTEDARPQTVSLLCEPGIRVLFEEQPYADFEISETTRKDGWIRLTMDVPVSFSLVQWILQWGRQVVVEKPAGLKNDVAEIVKSMAEYYLK